MLPGKSDSVWLDTTPSTFYPELKGDFSVDAAVIGGGIAGLTTAWNLIEAGLSVAVLEAKRIVTGVTGLTTAKFTVGQGAIYQQLLEHFSRDLVKQYAAANSEAIDWLVDLVDRERIDCDLRLTDMYVVAETEKDLKILRKELKAARIAGLSPVFQEKIPLPIPSFGALLYGSQVSFHPRKYLLALADLFKVRGGKIYEETKVLKVEEGEPCRIITETGTVRAKKVVVASHFPIYDPDLYFARLEPIRAYALGVELDGPAPEGMFIGLHQNSYSYRSLVYKTDKEMTDLLIVSGEAHKVGHGGDTRQYYWRMEEYLRRFFEVKKIAYHWSTQDNYTADSVPYIGKIVSESKHVYVATGFNGWGMSNGTVAGRLLADLILGRKADWGAVFNPSRFDLVGIGKLVKHNLDAVSGYALARLLHPEVKSLSEVKEGEGKIVQSGKERRAVYRDEGGKLHILSPFCTHMGCQLAWNTAERSWDCPCHGSRFDASGRVLNSPAKYTLKEYTSKESPES